MRMGKYGHELKLILLMTENKSYTALQLAEKLETTRRNLYNYFEYLHFSGFNVIKSGTTYRLDRSSPWLRKLGANVTLNRDEAVYMLRLLDDNTKHDTYAQTIRQKLIRQYNIGDVRRAGDLDSINECADRLRFAMEQKVCVVIHDYSSPHSNSVSDRVVEPFLFMNDGLDVRCHEINSHINKTFKLSRMGSIELTDVPWINEKQHKEVFTDIFMFSGEQKLPVTIRLDRLSRNLLLEEYPASAPCITPDADGQHWTFSASVASYLGIGRFVLGLKRHITVLGNDAFCKYIDDEIEAMR